MKREFSVSELLEAQAIARRQKGASGLVHRLAPPPDAGSVALSREIARDTNRLRLRLAKLRAGRRAPERAAVVSLLASLGSRLRTDASGAAQTFFEADPVGFANGKWLEIYVWDLLRREASKLGLVDVQHSVDLLEVDAAGERTTTDLDVAFAGRTRLGFVSCKTGTAEELKDEVFCVAARQRQVGGTFGRGVLLHWHPPTEPSVRKAVQVARQLGVRVLGREVLHDEPRLCRELVGDQAFHRP